MKTCDCHICLLQRRYALRPLQFDSLIYGSAERNFCICKIKIKIFIFILFHIAPIKHFNDRPKKIASGKKTSYKLICMPILRCWLPRFVHVALPNLVLHVVFITVPFPEFTPPAVKRLLWPLIRQNALYSRG